MTWDSRVVAVCTILTTLLALYGVVRSLQKGQREQARQIADEKQTVYNRGVVDGQRSRDDEVRQLTFERDDARADAARSQREADEWQRRYLDMTERGH